MEIYCGDEYSLVFFKTFEDLFCYAGNGDKYYFRGKQSIRGYMTWNQHIV